MRNLCRSTPDVEAVSSGLASLKSFLRAPSKSFTVSCVPCLRSEKTFEDAKGSLEMPALSINAFLNVSESAFLPSSRDTWYSTSLPLSNAGRTASSF